MTCLKFAHLTNSQDLGLSVGADASPSELNVSRCFLRGNDEKRHSPCPASVDLLRKRQILVRKGRTIADASVSTIVVSMHTQSGAYARLTQSRASISDLAHKTSLRRLAAHSSENSLLTSAIGSSLK
jgi:hypothetical protein